MGLTGQSTGRRAAREDWSPAGDGVVIALAGNPNVGKSTVFNSLTGLKQHTGNWTGKTVANAFGRCRFDPRITVADLPGTYSLAAHSEEERVARDFLCFEKSDAVIVVCDATCLERNLNLVLQTLEITRSGAVCVNLMDEARRNGVHIDIERLSGLLGVPVVAIGVPTVIESAHLGAQKREETLFLTPRDIDGKVRELSRLIGYGISLALQRGLSIEDITGLLG